MKKLLAHSIAICLLFGIPALTANAALDMSKSSYSAREVQFRNSMRELFAEYLIWQRIYTVGTINGAPDIIKAQTRFLQSQDGICNVFRSYFGDYAGNQITNLFKQYNQLISDYATATKNRAGKTFINVNKMYDKADEIANALSSANMNWTKAELVNMLKGYTDAVVKEIDLQGNNPGSTDPAIIDTTFDLNMEMADTFASGIIKQYPAKFW